MGNLKFGDSQKTSDKVGFYLAFTQLPKTLKTSDIVDLNCTPEEINLNSNSKIICTATINGTDKIGNLVIWLENNSINSGGSNFCLAIVNLGNNLASCEIRNIDKLGTWQTKTQAKYDTETTKNGNLITVINSEIVHLPKEDSDFPGTVLGNLSIKNNLGVLNKTNNRGVSGMPITVEINGLIDSETNQSLTTGKCIFKIINSQGDQIGENISADILEAGTCKIETTLPTNLPYGFNYKAKVEF